MSEAHDAVYRVWQAYLYMEAWGQPVYDQLDSDARAGFEHLVEAKQLFGYVEDAKREMARLVPDVPDLWLNPLCAATIERGEEPNQYWRDVLARITTAMYVRMIRLDAAAGPRTRPTGRGKDWNLLTVRAFELTKKKPGASLREIAGKLGVSPGHISRKKRQHEPLRIAVRGDVREREVQRAPARRSHRLSSREDE